jgi:hypothetical protein
MVGKLANNKFDRMRKEGILACYEVVLISSNFPTGTEKRHDKFSVAGVLIKFERSTF